MERITTGSPRLDAVLGGGLIANSLTLLAGVPGSGKTLLAEQCLFANATVERPALYLSTVSEPLDKLLRYGESLSFFATGEIGRSVHYDDLGNDLDNGGLPAVAERIDALVKLHRPAVLVIDSFRALRVYASDEREFRIFLHQLVGRLTVRALTSILVGEYDTAEIADTAESAVADTVILLASKQSAERTTRYLNVLKLRGSSHASGQHAYRLTADGLMLFPRLADRYSDQPVHHHSDRLSTGVAALDDALGDGYWPGSTTMVVGPSGSGKTIMGLHFLHAGAGPDEPGLLVSLQETRAQLTRLIAGFGWTLDDRSVTIMDPSPVDILVDEIAYDVLGLVEQRGVRRVVIDSINDLIHASPDETRFREFIVTLIRRLQHAGVSTLFTFEAPELFQIGRLNEQGMSQLADNVVLLQHVPRGHQMKRALTVLKTRGSNHQTTINELQISSAGLTLGQPIALHPAPQAQPWAANIS